MVNGVKSGWASVVSGVPQGTILCLLFSLYVNNISTDIESEISFFAQSLLTTMFATVKSRTKRINYNFRKILIV